MSSHITSLCRSGYYHLRYLRGMIQSLTPDATKTLVHAFISSRLDYCNSLLFGVADQQLKRLQSVQNGAARLVNAPIISLPVLKVLHWLPVRQRIQYKMAMLVHKCLYERAPEYLITDCCWAGSRRSGTRIYYSAGRQMLEVVRMNTSFGDRSYAAAAPHVWNGLADVVRNSALSEDAFAKLLKTYLMNYM